jgi:hypothetical protein
MTFLFSEAPITGTVYLQIFENFVCPQLEEEDAGVFQKDSALAPFSKLEAKSFHVIVQEEAPLFHGLLGPRLISL